MGNAAAPCKLTTDDTVRLSSSSVFNPAEIRALWFHFDAISNKQDKVSKAQFQSAMLFQDSILMDRIFAVFDADNDNLISFDDYVACLSTVSNKAKPEDKLKCALGLLALCFASSLFLSLCCLTPGRPFASPTAAQSRSKSTTATATGTSTRAT